jgi:hypothetical protein
VPDRDLAHLASTHDAALAALAYRAPTLGAAVPDRGKGLTPVERNAHATSSLLIESPTDGGSGVTVSAAPRG